MKYLRYAAIAWLVWAIVTLVVFAFTGIWLGNKTIGGIVVWIIITYIAGFCLGICYEMIAQSGIKDD